MPCARPATCSRLCLVLARCARPVRNIFTVIAIISCKQTYLTAQKHIANNIIMIKYQHLA
jgi:hypothetical protein